MGWLDYLDTKKQLQPLNSFYVIVLQAASSAIRTIIHIFRKDANFSAFPFHAQMVLMTNQLVYIE